MQTNKPISRQRGRPPKQHHASLETRDLLLQVGLEVLTEKGFSSSGLDGILKRASVPKGSFYHYFNSKEDYGKALIEVYAAYFARKLDRVLNDESLSPLERIAGFMSGAQTGMAKHHYERGCLVGNLGQEMGALPESFRERLIEVFLSWQSKVATCLEAAQEAGEISKDVDVAELAAFFWIGWEGAVLRAKLERSSAPLSLFSKYFLSSINAI